MEQEILEQLKQLNILTRVNINLLAKMILQLQTVKKVLHLPKLVSFTRFEILDDEYQELVEEFGKKEVNKALWYLDRQLVRNKMNCPNNIKKYISKKIQKNLARRKEYRDSIDEEESQQDS